MSETAPFSWAVLTPDSTVASGTCDFLVVPTANGELGILAGHAALVACVVPGDLRITLSGATRTLTVGAGLLEVRENEIRLLVGGVGG